MAMTEEEKQWRAESDARTIAEAAAISADTERLKAAQAAAKKMAEQDKARGKAMEDLGKGKNWFTDYSKG